MRRFLPYLAVETATVLAGAANGITMVAFPWLVLQETGDATAAATIAAVSALPLLLSTLFTGTLVDLVGRRRISIVSDLASMVSVALVPVLAATVGLDLWLLMAVAVLGAVFDPAGVTARESMLPETAERAGLPLDRANGIHEGAYGLAYLLGPGIGGLLIAAIGPTTTFWATAAAFALSALVIGVVRIPGGGRPPVHERPRGFWRSTWEGFRFLVGDRVLRALAILYAVLVGLWLPIEGVVLPYYFTGQDAPARLGLLVMAMSAGGAAGALGYAAVAGRMRRRTALVVAMLGTALPILGLALLPAYPLMVVLGLLTGLFFGPVGPIVNLAMQQRAPRQMRGRVVGAMSSAAYAAGPIGYLVAGPLIESLGLPTAFISLAVALCVAMVIGSASPALRGLDDPPPVDGAAGRPHGWDPDLVRAEAHDIAAATDEPDPSPADPSPAGPPEPPRGRDR